MSLFVSFEASTAVMQVFGGPPKANGVQAARRAQQQKGRIAIVISVRMRRKTSARGKVREVRANTQQFRRKICESAF
jgi:hypothetical protein